MDVVALESSILSELITAVATTPGSLISSGQVYVARSPRTTLRSDPEAWFRPVEPLAVEGGLGSSRSSRKYNLSIEDTGGTLAQNQRWAEQINDYFHGFRRPGVTGLIRAEVSNIVLDAHPRQGQALAMTLDIDFIGED